MSVSPSAAFPLTAVSVNVNSWPSPSSVVAVRSFFPNVVSASVGSTVISFTEYLFSIVGVSSTFALSVPSPLSVIVTVTVAGLPVVVQPSPAASSVIVYLYSPGFSYLISPNGIGFSVVSPLSKSTVALLLAGIGAPAVTAASVKAKVFVFSSSAAAVTFLLPNVVVASVGMTMISFAS